jgi:predicted nucleic-acid-binding protein
MLAVDTNVLVRLLARDDADRISAAEAFVSRGAWGFSPSRLLKN